MHLKLESIRKTFPGVVALDDVSFELHDREVHALCGENGAGKSTLVKVLSGIHAHRSYSGRILKDGQELVFRGLKDARRAGIAIVHQELALLPELSVMDNLFLGNEERGPAGWLRREEQRAAAGRLFGDLELDLPLDVPVKTLGIGQQQRLEIARALLHDPEVLILDEPTSALPGEEASQLLRWIRSLADKGTACVYISHRMEEVFAIADRITVLRDGRSVWTRMRDEVDPRDVVAAMVDRPPSDLYGHTPLEPGPVNLVLSNVRVVRAGRTILRVPELVLRSGEILGLAGLMGAGRTCLLRLVAGGLDPGTRIEGQWHRGDGAWRTLPPSPARARSEDVFLIPEDRKQQALFLRESIATNIVCASYADFRRPAGLDHQALRSAAEKRAREFRVKAPGVDVPMDTLSGGNQQKVLLCRAAQVAPRVLLLDEPTRGIDVGAKNDIYRLMEAWTRDGWSILWASSELQEVLGISDRVLVLAQGEPTGEFSERPFDERAVMTAATREPRLERVS